MARIAFQLRIRADRIQDYEEAHQRVWPELLQLLKSVGISQYSIFRRGVGLFLYMQVDDFERAWSEIDKSPVNQRWQKEMLPLFEPLSGLEADERFPMMREVFYLE
jgi:L-rhamnose mutarotase